jgi:SseB protein N-terminal domain
MSDSPDDPHNHGTHDHDHDHDHGEHDHDEIDLDAAIDAARTGLKSQVAIFVEALKHAEVYIPLSEDMPDAPEGEQIEIEGDLTFRPHMILNSDESIFAVGYTEPELVEPMQTALNWKTAGGELKFICVPFHVLFELAQVDVDGEPLSGLVLNPGTDLELVLQRDEAAAIGQGVAIPLVGYVADLPPDDEEETQIVEGAEPPPAELLLALERAVSKVENLVGTEVTTTFNPERDREPHLTITLTVIARDGLDRQALADATMEEAAPFLPAPGYADIVFRDAPN